MEERKRSRGRPKGSGIDDRETLMKIAAIIASQPETKRTTAIKKAGVTNPSVIRRLRDKFNEQADDLIASVKNGSGAKSARSAKPAAKPKAAKAAGTPAKSKASSAKPASKPAAKKAASAKAAASKTEPKKSAPKKSTAPKAAEPKKAAASKAAPKKATPKKATTRHTGTTAKAASAPKATNGKAGQPHLSSDLSKAGLMMADPKWMNTGVESVVSGLVEQQIQLYESALKHSPMATFLRQQAMMIDMTLSMLKAQEKWSGKSK